MNDFLSICQLMFQLLILSAYYHRCVGRECGGHKLLMKYGPQRCSLGSFVLFVVDDISVNLVNLFSFIFLEYQERLFYGKVVGCLSEHNPG